MVFLIDVISVLGGTRHTSASVHPKETAIEKKQMLRYCMKCQMRNCDIHIELNCFVIIIHTIFNKI